MGRQVVGKVKLEVEYVPFKVDPDAKATMSRRLTRRMSRSKINSDQKGVLTVGLVKATNLAVCTSLICHSPCAYLAQRAGQDVACEVKRECLGFLTLGQRVIGKAPST